MYDKKTIRFIMIQKVIKDNSNNALVVKLVDTKDLKFFKDKIYYLR